MRINKIRTHVFGHLFGMYLSRDNCSIGYVPIPKNASTSLKMYFAGLLDFEYKYNYNNCTKKKYIVCLRDPLDRWFSGITEYFVRHFGTENSNTKKPTIDINNKDVVKFIFDRKLFDEHTEPQINFLNSLNTDDIYFFKVDDNLTENICKFTTEMFNIEYDKCITSHKLKGNMLLKEPEKQSILHSLKSYAESNPHYIEEIKDCYKADYELINNVKYYGTN